MAKTLEQKLCKRSRGYMFVRNYIVIPVLYIFYRKIDVLHAKDVPNTGPVIFTPNHQNALMDAICILCTKDRQPVFVARADIFQKPLIIKILHFLRILPIYRKRDGGDSFDNNQETFALIRKTLDAGQAVGIMPEGVHNEIRHLRMLQKGVFRLAMQAQEKYGNQSGVKIIPVGLEYSDTRKFRSDIIVNYGKAIEMSDYYDSYVENPAKTLKKLQNILSEKMKEGMIDIDNELYYNEIERVRVFYGKRAAQRLGLNHRKAEDRLRVWQKIIAAMQLLTCMNPETMSTLCTHIREYVLLLEKYNLRDWVIEKQPYSFISLVLRSLLALLGVPFWCLGMLFNFIPYVLSVVASRQIKDPQFISSVQFVVSLVVYPLFYLIIIILSILLIPCLWGILTVIVLLVPMGVFAFNYYISIKKLMARYRFRNKKRKKDADIQRLITLREIIFEEMDKINL